ncbi:MAG: ABC transporter ATP-binding protein [Victivallales bacterium]|nr:ABC transporter ATP-binding protein [Victivallales bacterium]
MKITFEHVNKYFGDVHALEDINLTIEDGELFFLLGPSGCGKTTLLRCLGGFEQPTSGRVILGDKDVAGLPPNKRNTTMVFQGYALFPHLTVKENVAFGLEMRNVPKDELNRRVMEALERVQISQYGDRKPNELSGGQQQRVALARTLVVEPGCLLLDEPLANLDAKLRRDMRLEIRRICKECGLTGLYVTHDRQEALSMADRIAVLKDGRIRQVGAPREIYRRPADAFIANFIGETNFLEGTVKTVADDGSEIETTAGVLHSSGKSFKVGDKILLSLRPEALTPSGEGTNLLDVVVRQTAYLGEISDEIGALSDGQQLKYFEMNPSHEVKPGDKVILSIRPEDVVMLPYSEER